VSILRVQIGEASGQSGDAKAPNGLTSYKTTSKIVKNLFVDRVALRILNSIVLTLLSGPLLQK
jgi:hypothetical protein